MVTETPSDVLGAPGSLSATPGDGELALTWGTPSGSVKPLAYELRWRSAAGTFDDWEVAPCSSKRRHKVTGLTNGTTYTVEVRAAGNAGNGAASTTRHARQPVGGLPFPAASPMGFGKAECGSIRACGSERGAPFPA